MADHTSLILRQWLDEWAELQNLILALAERVHAQSELLSRRAERNTDTGVTTSVRRATIIEGVGKDAPVVENEVGAKQSGSPYRCDLFPPQAMLAVAKVLKEGADKYGDENWRGIPIRDHLSHAMTHMLAYLAGDSQDDHLGHAACRMLMALDLKKVEEGKPDYTDWPLA